eukprot:1941592-Rhodomonas_salina.2
MFVPEQKTRLVPGAKDIFVPVLAESLPKKMNPLAIQYKQGTIQIVPTSLFSDSKQSRLRVEAPPIPSRLLAQTPASPGNSCLVWAFGLCTIRGVSAVRTAGSGEQTALR